MAVNERVVGINLKQHWKNEPRVKRSKRSVFAIKEYVLRHTKTEQVKISPLVSAKVWQHGAKKPPAHIKVKLVPEKEHVYVLLPEEIVPKKVEKKTAGGLTDRVKQVAGDRGMKTSVLEKVKDVAKPDVDSKPASEKSAEKKESQDPKAQEKPPAEKPKTDSSEPK